MNKKMETAAYIEEDNSVRILYDDCSYESVYCSIMDDIMDTTLVGESRLCWLATNEPKEYARMVIEDTLKDYIDLYVSEYAKQKNRIKENMIQKGSDEQWAEQIARECMIYDR